jgi:hypothetical protein
MTNPNTTTTRFALEKAQLALTIALILGFIIYVGRRLEADEHQGKLLENIAADINTMKDRNADANAQIRVISERVSQVEKRLERMENRP